MKQDRNQQKVTQRHVEQPVIITRGGYRFQVIGTLKPDQSLEQMVEDELASIPEPIHPTVVETVEETENVSTAHSDQESEDYDRGIPRSKQPRSSTQRHKQKQREFREGKKARWDSNP